MKRLLLYTAVLALMAGSAMAQPRQEGAPHENRGHGTTNPSRQAPKATNQQVRPSRQAQQQAPQHRPTTQTEHRPTSRSDHRPTNQSEHRPPSRSDHRSDRRPPNQSERRPTSRPDYRSRAARPHAEWNRWRSQNRNYFNRPSRRFHAPRYSRPNGWYYRRWSFGDFLPSLFWSSQYWINNYSAYALPPPPPGAMWVRYGDDAVLIDRYSGEVIDVIYGIFY